MAGRGSIEWRGDNSARLVVSCGFDGDDNRIKKTKTVRITSREKQKEAEKLLAEFVTEVEKGLFIDPSKMTFKEFTKRWLKDYADKELAPKTVHRYRQLLDSRIYPAMGHLRIEKITPTHLVQFYSNLQEDGIREDGKEGTLSPRTILHHHRLISAILQDAVEWQVIAANPAARVKAPKVQKKQAAYYDEEQIPALLAALDTVPLKHQVLVKLTMAAGLRREEVMGLDWKHINLDDGTVEICEAAQYIPGQGQITKGPKNETSIRTIALPPSIVALLKQYRAHMAERRLKVGDLWQGSDRLFVTWDGRPGHPEWPSQWFAKFVKKHNLAHLNFHGLRHTAGTFWAASGAPLKNVSARLGHANISTTADIYAHALKSVDREIASRMDDMFQRIPKASEAKKGRG